nr:YitT family protein [uncultured Anaerostipes sp.]
MKNYLKIAAGTFCMAAATNTVFQPLGIVTGGFSGLGIILWNAFRIPLWAANTILNVPLFIAAYRQKKRRFFWNTLLGAALLSFFLGILPRFSFFPQDFYVNLILGSLLMGIGIGIILQDGNSTGGTDLIAFLMKKRFPAVSIAVLLGIFDGIIVFAGIFAFGIEKACYALLCIYGITKIADMTAEGLGVSRLFFVISEKGEEIAERILYEKNRGVTKVDAQGGYTGCRIPMLLCVVSKKEAAAMKDLVREYDPNAFVVITDAREILGEGFVKNIQ